MSDRARGFSRREFLKVTAMTGLALGAGCAHLSGSGGKKPNVILFLVDDMGWMDSTVYGSEYYETPNMERLAKRGMMFTNAYAASPICSPTRASLMTGKYPGRLNMTLPAGHLAPEPGRPPLQQKGAAWQKVLTPNTVHQLALEEYTIAEAFRDNGYATGFVGKWHLGFEPFWPEKNGFDINIGGGQYAGPPSYFSPYHIKPLPDGPEGEYLPERLTLEAIRYMKQDRDKPYFLCLWHYSVHSPYQEKEQVSAHYRDKKDPRGKQKCAVMAAMIEAMDDSLGRVLDTLDATGQTDNTIFVFMSDNGGNMYDRVEGNPPTNNAPLRSGKGSIYEGGVREPCVFVWPGVIQGGTQSDTVISTIDFYPTLLEMAGVEIPEQPIIDGISIAAHLRNGKPLKREAIFCHYPHYVPATLHRPATSVRKGKWKLIRFYGEGPDQSDRLELYNLEEDIGETRDLSAEKPELAEQLNALISRHLEETGSVVPVPNPDWVPGTVHPNFLPPSPPLGGWTPAGCDLSAGNGRLIIDSRGGDAYIMSDPIGPFTGPLTIQVSMSSVSSGVGQVFYKPEGGFYDSKRRSNFDIKHDGKTHTYEVTIPDGEQVGNIRIDPCMSQGRVEIDEVRVLNAQSNTLKHWGFEKVEAGRQRQAEPTQHWP